MPALLVCVLELLKAAPCQGHRIARVPVKGDCPAGLAYLYACIVCACARAPQGGSSSGPQDRPRTRPPVKGDAPAGLAFLHACIALVCARAPQGGSSSGPQDHPRTREGMVLAVHIVCTRVYRTSRLLPDGGRSPHQHLPALVSHAYPHADTQPHTCLHECLHIHA